MSGLPIDATVPTVVWINVLKVTVNYYIYIIWRICRWIATDSFINL